VAVPPVGWLRAIRCAGRRQGNVNHDGGGANAGSFTQDKSLGLGLCPLSPMRRVPRHGKLFRKLYLLASRQLYEAEDASSMLAYREARTGQMLEEGNQRSRALSSWTGLRRRTAYIPYRCCPSTFTTRCSASNGSVISFGPPPINGRGDS